jgi:hypothetical protein
VMLTRALPLAMKPSFTDGSLATSDSFVFLCGKPQMHR